MSVEAAANRSPVRSLSGWIPLILAGAALALLGGYLVTGPHEPYMVVENGVPREDEGAIAHTWQLLMLLQLPAILFFAVRWLPRDPRRASMMIGLHGLAFIAAALPVYLLEH
jgi:hypothetical protein